MSRFSESVEHLKLVRQRSKEQFAFTEHLLHITHPDTREGRESSFVTWFTSDAGRFLGDTLPRVGDANWAVALRPAVTALGLFTVRHIPIGHNSRERVSQLVQVEGQTAEAIHEATTVLASADMHERLWVPGKQDMSAEDLRSVIVVTNEVLRYHELPIYQRPH